MSKAIKIVHILLLFLLLTSSLMAQDKPLRVEVEAKAGSDAYMIIPFGQKGVLLFYQSNQSVDRLNKNWYFTMYDTNFKEMWSKEQPVRKDLGYRFFDYNEKNLFLYLENNASSFSTGDCQIIKIDVDSAKFNTYNTSINSRATVTGFKVIGNTAMLAGRTNPSRLSSCGQSCFSLTLVPYFFGVTMLKFQPFLFVYNMDYGTSKIISDIYEGQAYVDNLAIDRGDSTFAVNIKNHIPRKKNATYIDVFNTDGSKINSLKLVSNRDDRKLNSARVASVNENEKIIIGTYNNITSGTQANPAFAGFEEGSSGIYFTRIVDGEQKVLTFYNFSKFKNFYSFISENRANRIMKKAKRKEAQGKELSFDYQLLVHDIIKKDSNYIMVAEVYYPEYHTVNYTSFDAYGRPITTSYTVFDGYRYTNAIVAGFDKQGNLLWDNSIEIWNILTFNLRERVKVMFDGTDIILAYSSEGKIATKIVRNNEVIEGKQYTKIESKYDNDKLISDYNSDMEYWYGSYFISYGYQKIKNTSQDKSKRTVFYFNKIAFQ